MSNSADSAALKNIAITVGSLMVLAIALLATSMLIAKAVG